jgi:hypothetical protein
MIADTIIDVVDLGDAFEETRQNNQVPMTPESIFVWGIWPD